jgi:hypothetical protein
MPFAFVTFARAAVMATRAIFGVGDTTAGMADPDCLWLMPMTAETGVAADITGGMTGDAGRVVRIGQRNQPGVTERPCFPVLLRVVLPAMVARFGMERARWSAVTPRALAPHICL